MKHHSLGNLKKIMIVMAVGIGIIGGQASGLTAVEKQENPPVVAKCKVDLAKRLKLEAQDISVGKVLATTWPDASLGIPEVGKAYAQVETPGFRIILEANNSKYLYTASAKAFKYGGPIDIWACSMLYLKPIHNEPNLNSDLYQCSLLGTNNVLIASGVTDYYPQEKGALILVSRTSRSSFDLLYLKASENKKPRIIYSSFAFGDMAINDKGDTWAGLVKPMVGAAWNITIGGISQNDADKQILALPDGVYPEQIAWSGESIMILGKKDGQLHCYEISPKAEKPEWKEVGVYLFPKMPDYMLNKSETLEISQVTENDKPAVEVARVWFTGDRNVIARISDFTMKGSDLLAGGFAFIWGESGSKPSAYSVDISTGEVIPGLQGTGQDIKPFLYPPKQNPIIPELLK